jgi:hypothetical protein
MKVCLVTLFNLEDITHYVLDESTYRNLPSGDLCTVVGSHNCIDSFWTTKSLVEWIQQNNAQIIVEDQDVQY